MLTPGAAVDQVGANGTVDPISADAPRWRWREAGTYSLRNPSAERVLGVQLENQVNKPTSFARRPLKKW